MHWMKIVLLALLTLLTWGLGGCLLDDDEDSVLSIELLWDERPGPDFAEGTCSSAGADWMIWSLLDADGAEIAFGDEECAEFIDVFNVPPGDYTLEIDGFDADDEALWSTACEGLELRRFNSLFVCDVEAL
jgi:hypothetical protein